MLKMKDDLKWRATQVIGLASTFLFLIRSRGLFLVYDTQLILRRFYLECSGYTHKKCSLYVHKNTSQETAAAVGHTALYWCVHLLANCMFMCCFLKPPSPPCPANRPSIFLLCLLMICKYSRAGKYMKSFCPKCLTQKTTIFAVPTLLWIVFFSHMRSISLLLVSLLFQEQATKVVRSNQGHGFLSPVPFALAKFWSFQCSVPWTLGKYNTLLKSLNSYCFLIIYVSMVSSCPSQGLRPYCSGNCTNK